MAVLHRALFTWFITLIFLILVVLRLDQRVRWSWFIVFVPMWLYDCILLMYLIFLMGSHRRTSNDRWQRGAVRHMFCLAALILKVSAEILLCLRLEGSGLKLYYMMIPVWIGLPILTLDVFLSLFDRDILELLTNLRNRWQTFNLPCKLKLSNTPVLSQFCFKSRPTGGIGTNTPT